jgi:hypothetical protein
MAPFSLRCWKNGDCSTLEAMVAVEWLAAGAGVSELGARLYHVALTVAFPAVVGPRRAYLMQLACQTTLVCCTTSITPAKTCRFVASHASDFKRNDMSLL